jgi:hypothetical protein
MRKRKISRQAKVIKSTLPLSTNAIVEDKAVDSKPLMDLTTTTANV